MKRIDKVARENRLVAEMNAVLNLHLIQRGVMILCVNNFIYLFSSLVYFKQVKRTH